MPSQDPLHVPARLRARVDAIAALADAFAAEHLSAEYAEMCRRMAAALAQTRPSPLEHGEARTWAAGILYAVGWVNFLDDPSQAPHMPNAELARKIGVAQGTISLRFRDIRHALDLARLEPAWTLPSRLADNPLAWMILVDGVPMDARSAPREVQEEALRAGIIPFLPDGATGADDDEADGPDEEEPERPDDLRAALGEAGATIERLLAAHPAATDEELNAAVASTVSAYNHRPQAELGGLSPLEVHLLLRADWEGAASAIRLDDSVALADLDAATTLHDARLVLAMLAEGERVKATPKGNLPRPFVAAFRVRMRRADVVPDEDADFVATWEAEHPPRREEDLRRLHIARLLLELAGLVKRRQGLWSPTRRGEQLAADDRAGALLAALVRSQFRRLNLAYLDGADDVPGFQQTIGYTLCQFQRSGRDWRTTEELADAVILPAVRATVPEQEYFDEAALILEMRFLRPLQALGLAEARPLKRVARDPLARFAWRKTPLFDRVLRFDLTGDG